MAGDDRLLPLTRAAFAPLCVLPAVFGPLLVLLPDHTDVYWAWLIRPAMSATWVGAGYIFGAIASTTVLVVGRWRTAIVPVVGTWSLSVGMLVATLLHLDRFFRGTPQFWVWLFIYIYLPLGLPLIWWLNRGRDPGPQPEDLLLPRALGAAGALAAAAFGILAMVLFISPAAGARIWPWPLTPLMARVVGSWLLFLAAGAGCLAVERRYLAYRAFIPGAMVWFTILLVVSVVHRGDFLWARASAWVYFLALVAMIAALGALFTALEGRYRATHGAPLCARPASGADRLV